MASLQHARHEHSANRESRSESDNPKRFSPFEPPPHVIAAEHHHDKARRECVHRENPDARDRPISLARRLVKTRSAEGVEDLKRVEVAVLKFTNIRLPCVDIRAHLRRSVRPAHVEIKMTDGLGYGPVDFSRKIQLPH